MSSRRSTVRAAEVSSEEQAICVTCGMCCDGTLFMHAHLNAGERGNLPEKIERQSYSKGGKDYFRLPCRYFKGWCTIYDRERADVCSGYRCQLLKNFEAGKITLETGMKVVFDAINMRKEIMARFSAFSGSTRRLYFKKLLRELGKTQEGASAEVPVSLEYEMLLARCNIFEALLIKHFLSEGEFEKYMMPESK